MDGLLPGRLPQGPGCAHSSHLSPQRSDSVRLPQGKPPHEDNRFLAYLRAGMIWDQLEKSGVPGVCGVWSPPEGGNRLMTVVALKTQYVGHAKQAGLITS